MVSIKTILRHFGFTVRELAEVLNLSHTLMLQVEKGDRTAPAHLRQTLAHPLFAEIDTDYTPEPETNTIETGWLQAQLAVARAGFWRSKPNGRHFKKSGTGFTALFTTPIIFMNLRFWEKTL